MKTFNNLLHEFDTGVLRLTISRPKSLNALNKETMDELNEAFDEIASDEAIKGVILSGAGDKSFVAGADITELTKLDGSNGQEFASYGQGVLSKIENLPKPVIAAVNGYALGGGCEIAMACHMRTAVKSAIFGQPEVNLGVIPGYGGTQRLTRLIGKGRAFELMATGDSINAEEALRLGLVNHVYETHQELAEETEKLMRKILSKASVAVSMVVDSVNHYFESQDGYPREASNFANCLKTEDFKEGTQAFLEKRKPNFKGR